MKLDGLIERHEEISALLSEVEVMADQNQFRDLSKEYSQLEPLVKCFSEFRQCDEDLEEAKLMLDDPEMKDMAEEEIGPLKNRMQELEGELQILLIPKDKDDNSNVYLEIRAGTGGDEAALFSGDLFKMYGRYAEKRRWKVEIVSESQSEMGGYKEIICRITGDEVYASLKFESGAHRVQRVPETESQGRIHTSACTVAIMPEVDDVDEIEINAGDLRVDTFRASGAGGQHVNKTDSAIRLTHLPTGVVVECQDERSQHKNKAKAMKVLQSRLYSAAQEAHDAEQSEARKKLVGTGDRSDRIRTYNYPQGRVTDHRINLTLYKLDDIMQGEMGQLLQPLVQEYQADQLAALAEA